MTNRFQLLAGAEDFTRELGAALEGCRHSLYAQFMTYEGDASGRAFSQMLAAKAAAGVDVRLLVDGYTDMVLSDAYPYLIHRQHAVRRERAQTYALFDSLRACGVGVERTAPPGFLGRFFPYRNHKKMIVLDERVAFIGGINISDHNYAWHDFMMKIEGPLVQDLTRDFCSTWDGATIALDGAAPDGDFVLNQCAGRYSIFHAALALIQRAERSLVIESPYLLGDHFEQAIRAAGERGVRVTIILPAHSNKLVYRLWSRKLRRRLDHPNIAIYGHASNGGMTHAKLLVADDFWATFGSYNMIELEGLTQKELNVFTTNPECIAQIKAFVARDLADSARLPVPRIAFGRFTYSLLYRLVQWRTERLLRNPTWTAIYC